MGLYLVESVLILTAALFLCAGAFRLFKGESKPTNKSEGSDDQAS